KSTWFTQENFCRFVGTQLRVNAGDNTGSHVSESEFYVRALRVCEPLACLSISGLQDLWGQIVNLFEQGECGESGNVQCVHLVSSFNGLSQNNMSASNA